ITDERYLYVTRRAGLGHLSLPPMCHQDRACSHIFSFSFAGEAKGRCLMRRMSGIVLTVTGILACPCHLIVTLPLLTSLLVGTRLSSFLKQNTGLVIIFAGIYFVLALALGYWLLFSPKRSKQ